MGSADLSYLRSSAMGWGLWKVLDHLLLQYSPEWWPQVHHLAAGGVGRLNGAPSGVNPAAERAPDLAAVLRSAEFAEACRELNDPASPVLRALTQLWAARDAGPAAAASADDALRPLTAAQSLVVLAVLAQALASR